MPRIDAQMHRHLDRLVELRESRLLDDLQRAARLIVHRELTTLRRIVVLLPVRVHQPVTSMPIERAAPATIASAASIVSQLRSGILSSAILRTWARVTLPTFCLFGVPDPFSTPASFFNNTAAGGVFVMNVNDLSLKMVTSTGKIIPSCDCVLALNSLQNAMMLMPCGPSAVPTGGAGFARPAGICNFTNPTAFFAIVFLTTSRERSHPCFTSLWSATGRCAARERRKTER